MPRDASGNYTLPLGNPVVGGTVIDVDWANPTMADIAAQLNNVYTRDGLLGPLDAFKIVDGTLVAPGLAFNSEPGTGWFKESQNVMALAMAGQLVAKFAPTSGLTLDKLHVAEAPTTGAPPLPIATVPTGTVLDFAGGTAPSGYLLCNGQAVSRTTYAALFTAIGTTWGVGDNSTTFNVPDLRRKVTMGAGGTAVAGPGNALGNIGGAETHVLVQAELATHTHVVADATHYHSATVSGSTGYISHDHAHSFTTDAAGDHQHRHQAAGHTSVWQGYDLGYAQYGGGTPDDLGHIYMTETGGSHTHTGWTSGVSSNHYHTFTVATNTDWKGSNISLNATGNNYGHNNVQPSAVVNKIIKT